MCVDVVQRNGGICAQLRLYNHMLNIAQCNWFPMKKRKKEKKRNVYSEEYTTDLVNCSPLFMTIDTDHIIIILS